MIRCTACGEAAVSFMALRTHEARTRHPRDMAALFRSLVAVKGDCLEWIGPRAREGYGRTGHGYAHRVAWERAHGPIPVGLFVLHHCDNPPCVKTEPDEQWPDGHLFLGTHLDNVRDMDAKGRRPVGDLHWAHRLPDRRPTGERHGTRTKPHRIPRGERHGMARLTAVQVLEIRASSEDKWTLAARYGVSPSTVWMAVHRYTWKHL